MVGLSVKDEVTKKSRWKKLPVARGSDGGGDFRQRLMGCRN